MSESSYKSIRNGAVASIIAGVILLSVPVLREYTVKLLSWLWSGMMRFWVVLISAYSLPGWIWLIIFLFALIGVITIFIALKGGKEKPEHFSYVEDFLFGAKWRWQWVANQISNIWCYCPRCDGILVYDDSSCRNYLADIKKTDFLCENCGLSVVASIRGGNRGYALGAVEREIDRRVRTGEYKQH